MKRQCKLRLAKIPERKLNIIYIIYYKLLRQGKYGQKCATVDLV